MTNYKKWDDLARTIQDDGSIAPIIDPKDISVTFGKPMTEAEFLAHRAQSGLGGPPPTVIRANQQDPKDPKDKLRTKLQAMAQSRTGTGK